MKIIFNRYTEMSCFTLRGLIGVNEWRMLKLGFDLMFKTLEGMLVINLINAEVSPEVLPQMLEYKKGISKLTKQKVFIVQKERGLGDFTKMELLLTRFQGSKMRQIGELIIVEDQIFALEQEIATLEAKIQQLGFDENSSKIEIQKNVMVKTKGASLEGCLKWQKGRQPSMHKVPSSVEDLDIKLKATLEELISILGKEIEI